MVPISYSPRSGSLGQHHYNLKTYKGSTPSVPARWRLLAILLLFLRDHLGCIADRMGFAPSHLATVPSTRGRQGRHPLATLIGSRLGLPEIVSAASPRYGPDERDFHPDWFTIAPVTTPAHVLIVDDTWTTGSRAQSLAFALKASGAATVATVVLGRHVDPEYKPSKRLLDTIQQATFDPSRCAAEDTTTNQLR